MARISVVDEGPKLRDSVGVRGPSVGSSGICPGDPTGWLRAENVDAESAFAALVLCCVTQGGWENKMHHLGSKHWYAQHKYAAKDPAAMYKNNDA